MVRERKEKKKRVRKKEEKRGDVKEHVFQIASHEVVQTKMPLNNEGNSLMRRYQYHWKIKD